MDDGCGGGGGGGGGDDSKKDFGIILGSSWKYQGFSELDLGRRMTVDWPSSFK